MIKLRDFHEDDILLLDELWRAHWTEYSLPHRDNRIIDSVVVDDDKIIGYGQVKLFSEAMLFLDPTVRVRNRIRAIDLLMHEAFRGTNEAQIEELYCFIKDPKFSALIQKRYNFKLIPQPGDLLLRKV